MVSDGKDDSDKSSVVITVVEGVNPLAGHIDFLVVNGSRMYGLNADFTQKSLEVFSTACRLTSVDLDPDGIVRGAYFSRTNFQKVDPSQALCMNEARQPEDIMGIAFDADGTRWATSSLYTSSDNQTQNTKLFRFDEDDEVALEVDFRANEPPFGTDNIFGIDFAPDGQLYGVAFSTPHLMRIDTETAEASFVATLQGSGINDIDIDAGGILRYLDDTNGVVTLYEYRLDGSLIQSFEVDTVEGLGGFNGIVSNSAD